MLPDDATLKSWSGHNASPQTFAGQERTEPLNDPCTDRPHQQDDHQGDARSGTEKEPADDGRWQLDPQRLPRSLTLELPEPLMTQFLALAETQGRCLDEIALELLDAQMQRDRI